MEASAAAAEWADAEPSALQLRALAAALRKQDDVPAALRALSRLEVGRGRLVVGWWIGGWLGGWRVGWVVVVLLTG
jgi:hypothetical protein